MIQIKNNYKFNISVSHTGYNTKNEVKAALTKENAEKNNVEKISFKAQSISCKDFLDLATRGYCFCNIFDLEDKIYTLKNGRKSNPFYHRGLQKDYFKISFKSDQYFKSSQALFIDIDYTEKSSISDFCKDLINKPTLGYYSFSDNILKIDNEQVNNPKYDPQTGIKSRRFRLIYVFTDQLGKAEIKAVSKKIYDQIEDQTREIIQDKCGERVSQFFIGSQNKDTYFSGSVYSFDDFCTDSDITDDEPEPEKISLAELKEKTKIDRRLVWDMKTLDYPEFMHRYSKTYNFFYRSNITDWTDDKYYLPDQNFYKLYFNSQVQKDGQKRRKKLYFRMLERMYLSNFTATPEDLLFNAYVDREKFFDNSDNILTIDCLQDNVVSAYNKTPDEVREILKDSIIYNQEHKPKIILKDTKGLSRSEINVELKNSRYSEIKKYYDQNISITENLENLKNKGINICKQTLYNFINSNESIKDKKKQRNDLILKLYDKSKTDNENLEILRLNDIEISRMTLYRILKKNNNNTENKTEDKTNILYNQNVSESNKADSLWNDQTTDFPKLDEIKTTDLPKANDSDTNTKTDNEPIKFDFEPIKINLPLWGF